MLAVTFLWLQQQVVQVGNTSQFINVMLASGGGCLASQQQPGSAVAVGELVCTRSQKARKTESHDENVLAHLAHARRRQG